MATGKELEKLKKAEEALEKVFDRVSQIPEFARLSQLSDALREWKAAVQDILSVRDRQVSELERRLAAADNSLPTDARTREELLAIHKLARSIRVARQPEEIAEALQQLVAHVVDIIEAEIFIEQNQKDTYFPLMPQSEHPALHTAFQQYLEEGIIAWVIDAQQALVVDDLETISEAAGTKDRRHYLVVPIIQHSSTTGIYLVHTRTARDELDEEQLELVTLLTEHAASAIENLRLTEELHDMRNRDSERSEA